jgi:hypothetical protein
VRSGPVVGWVAAGVAVGAVPVVIFRAVTGTAALLLGSALSPFRDAAA